MNQTSRAMPVTGASIYVTDTHYYICAQLGFAMAVLYPEGASHVLPVGATADDLGAAIIDALDNGRYTEPNDPEFERLKNLSGGRRFMTIFDDFATRSGLANGKSLLRKRPKHVGVVRRETAIVISPSRRTRPSTWEYMKDEPDVMLPRDASARAVGEGIVEAVGMCV